MTEKLGKILMDIYRPRFEEQFKHHPRGSEIVDKMCSGEPLPSEVVDLYFAEAEHYAWEHFKSVPPPPVNPDGTVTFKVVHRE